MFGLYKDYYIAEAILNPSEVDRRLSMMKREVLERMESIPVEDEVTKYRSELINSQKLFSASNFKRVFDSDLSNLVKQNEIPIPKAKLCQKVDTPPEPIGVGLNRYTYFVVNDLTEDWIELPSITPRQIINSRYIIKFLKGDLEADVDSYPYFHGKEKHYLRTLIARITSSTYVAPKGFYKRAGIVTITGHEEEDEEKEEEEEGEDEEEDNDANNNDDKIIKLNGGGEIQLTINRKYKPMSVNYLQDIRMWVHIRSTISQQGRITFFDDAEVLSQTKNRTFSPTKRTGEETEYSNEEEEDGEQGQYKEYERKKEHKNKRADEIPVPSILTSCAEDKTSEITPPWIIRLSNSYNKSNVVVVIKSSLWQGAYSFAFENHSDNLYIGWGNKYVTRNFSPQHLPNMQNEYPHEFEISEIIDPSVIQEEEWKSTHFPKTTIPFEETSGESNTEDESESTEDDDDTD